MPYIFQPSSKKFLGKVKQVNHIKQNKIIAFAPHSDDLSIGAGGFLAQLGKDNHITPVLAYSGWRGVEGNLPKEKATLLREKEMFQETKVLKIKPPIFLRLPSYEKDNSTNRAVDVLKIKAIITQECPSIIFLPNKFDLHPRHQLLSHSVLKALKDLCFSVKLFFYEIPWSVFSSAEYNFIVPLTNDLMKRKIEAIKNHKSQLSRTNFVRLSKALLALRAGMVPEQKINGYGSSGSIGNWVEVYKYKNLKF